LLYNILPAPRKEGGQDRSPRLLDTRGSST
jgi:hypothetical protein